MNNKTLKEMAKGITNNPFGRPKGTPNKITADLREFVGQLLSDNLEQFNTDFQQLEAKDRLIIMEKLLSYVLPKLSNITLNEEQEPERLKTKEEFLSMIERTKRNDKLKISENE